ncbi:MAG: MlaE family lipid ABC transporter permease subunit [Smithellaceae bacterium]
MDAKKDWQKRYQISSAKQDSKLILYLTGEFGLKNLSSFTGEIISLFREQKIRAMDIDFAGITYIDSAAALCLIQIQKAAVTENIDCTLINLNDETKGIFSVIYEKALTQAPLKDKEIRDGLVTQIGNASVNIFQDVINFIMFAGELIYALTYTVIHPKSLRTRDVFFYMKRAGVDGLPIVGLISMLIGLILAFMSYLQLRSVGANIYVPSLVSFAMVKELGPIMTAILVAGRSGSAFAAEIGTMVVNEEIDALNTMGFDPIRFLAVPKVLASVIVVPVLTLYSDFFGILGGLIVGITGLDLTANTYILQSLKTIQVFDLVTSLIKAAVFAVIIAGIGCQRGFQVRAGAQDVGKYTTSAVVSAIFLIVVADSIFAIMFYYMR